ncbi:MAG: two-component regulator propeller domain-containing protein, partial [Verrucomicrobiota bacterium]
NGSSFEHDVQLPDPVEQFVWALESDATGLLWIGTNKGLWFFDGSSFFSCENEHPLSKLQVTSLYRAADQSIWVGTASGLFRVRRTDLAGSRGERVIQLLAPNNVDRFTTSDGLLDDHIRAITGNGDGPIWIGTANGLSRYDGTRFRNLTLRDGLPAPAVTALAVDSDGSVWMGFSTGMRLGRGIARYDGSTLINYTIADGMPNDAVTGLHFGRDGVLWIGTDGGGVMAYDPGSFVNFTVRDGLPNNYVGKVSTDPNGGVWISAGWRFVFEGGLFRVATPVTPAGAHRLENYGERIGLPRRFWHSIVTDAHGALWFQGPKANVHRYDGTRLTELPHQSGALAVGREGTVWSLATSGLARFDGKEFVAVPNTFDTPLATSALLVTRDGDCWFALNRSGHPDALIRFDGTSYSTPLARQQVWLSAVAFSEADDGSIWVAGWTGIGRFSGTTLEMIATEKALPHASVEAAYAAPDGSIWIGTTGGLARYDGSAWSLIDVRDGLPSTETLSIAAAPDGAIWVGTSAGACRFQPNKVAPVARIISVQSEASHTNLDRLPDFRTGNRLTLRFDSIDLKTVPAKRQFRSAVFGGNAGPNERFNWLSPSSDMQFEWTPERPGTYTFAVQAIDRDLNYSTPALLTLNVVTPWYANTWVLYAGGAAFTLSAGIALLSTLRSRQRKLEAQHLRERLLLEERKAREAAESAKNAADEANQAKSQFLASMSHELRTPLNAIIGYSEIVQEELTDLGVKEVIPDLQKINAAARHQLGLVNDILDLSKIEAGKMTLFIEEFDVSKLVNEVASTIQPLVAKNSNNLVVDCPADIGTMRSDQTKLRQTLFNLLSNACKFTERGVITLRVQSEISNFRFEITDTGIGMTPEQITKLFQAFTQADASTSKKYGGTGLGLALSKKFCQMMHGELSLTSDYGKGSTFTVLLPAKVSAGKT